MLAALTVALFVVTAATTFADTTSSTYRSLHLEGASPTITLPLPPPVPGGLFDYIYTIKGNGTVRVFRGDASSSDHVGDAGGAIEVNPNSRLAVLWSYLEHGTVFSPTAGQINSAVYTITPQRPPSGNQQNVPSNFSPFKLHVITSTYVLHWDNPAQAPCSNGSFSYSFQEDASAQGTFTFKPLGNSCIPTYSLDVFITPGGQTDQHLGQH